MGNFYTFVPSKNTNILWRYFEPIITNPFGTAALIAGLYLKSECDPYTGYENYIGYDNLEFKDFAYDKKGFGIGKWKNWTRKLSLYNFCKKAGVPIYDISKQAEFVMDEFSGTTYGPILKELKEATSVPEAAYLVYDKYLDITNHDDDKRETCATLAMAIYDLYGRPTELKVPVKYVFTDRKGVRVKGQKGKIIPFVRKTLGYLEPDKEYRFISVSEDGEEYALYFGDDFGYVNANKTCVITRMEAL